MGKYKIHRPAPASSPEPSNMPATSTARTFRTLTWVCE